jgi:3-methyladenine DNA glycosylase AlkD
MQEVMATLQSLGTEQNRKTYQRHGSGPEVFGVSFAHLKTLAKKIKRDHKLAYELWDTKNVDAQALATMILDPEKLDEKTASKWIDGIDYSLLAGLLAGCIAQSKFKDKAIVEWTNSKDEYIKQCGYDTLSHMLKEVNFLSDSQCSDFLTKIEREIKTSPNRARYAMNNALIVIGIYRPNLTSQALEISERLGKIEVDHGNTSCKTPDAKSYILKALTRTSK